MLLLYHLTRPDGRLRVGRRHLRFDPRTMRSMLPSFGVSNAAAMLVGQNLGAGKPDRAEVAAFSGYGMVLTQAFNGAGDTRRLTLINLAVLWLWEIPLAWLLAGRGGFGPTGAFIAVSIAFLTLAGVSSWLFSKGDWKQHRV